MHAAVTHCPDTSSLLHFSKKKKKKLVCGLMGKAISKETKGKS